MLGAHTLDVAPHVRVPRRRHARPHFGAAHSRHELGARLCTTEPRPSANRSSHHCPHLRQRGRPELPPWTGRGQLWRALSSATTLSRQRPRMLRNTWAAAVLCALSIKPPFAPDLRARHAGTPDKPSRRVANNSFADRGPDQPLPSFNIKVVNSVCL